MATLRGTSDHVSGCAISLEFDIKNLRSIFNVTHQLIRRFDDEDDDVVAMIALVKIGHEQCEQLEGISKGVR